MDRLIRNETLFQLKNVAPFSLENSTGSTGWFGKKHLKVCSESMLSTVSGSMDFSCSVVAVSAGSSTCSVCTSTTFHLLPSLLVKVFVIHLLLYLHPQVSQVCPQYKWTVAWLASPAGLHSFFFFAHLLLLLSMVARQS